MTHQRQKCGSCVRQNRTKTNLARRSSNVASSERFGPEGHCRSA